MLRRTDDPAATLAAALAIALALAIIAGCTYYERPGMNEWDYRMYQEGWQLEHIGNSEDLRWTNDTSTNAEGQPLD